MTEVLTSLGPDLHVVVAGASGGIGGAITDLLAASGNVARIDALCRSGGTSEAARVHHGRLDLEDDASIAAAAGALAEGGPPDAILIATGILHGPDLRPEKDWRMLDGDGLARLFRVNATGPMLFLGRVLEALPRDGKRRIVGVVSARVGSISDNRAGGWYGYRASKAALNQFIRTTAIECARRRPGTLIVGLQPGTVRTGLSAPFRTALGEADILDPETSARRLLEVLDGLTAGQSGLVLDWRGEAVPA